MTRAVGQGPLGPSGAPGGGGALRLAMLHPYRLRTSGSGVYLVRVARELLRHGHHVTLLSHDDDADQALGEPAGAAAAQGRWRARSLRGVGTPVAYPRAEESRVLFRDLPDAGLRRYLDHHVEEATRAARGVDVVHVNGEVPLSFVAAEVRRRTGTRTSLWPTGARWSTSRAWTSASPVSPGRACPRPPRSWRSTPRSAPGCCSSRRTPAW
ncbi:MAG: glycosyltransferase family 4 protein [Actinomycetota bacterium]|nr:glycosyltransferase family 4 protein [Actinomycetota bacterium]